MSRGGGYNSSYKGKRGGYQGNWNNGHGNNNNNNSNNGPYKKSLSNYKGNGKPQTDTYNGYQGKNNNNYNSNGGNKWNRNNNYQNNQSPNSYSRGGNYSPNNNLSIEPIIEENVDDSNNNKIFKYLNNNLKDYKKSIPQESANVRENHIKNRINNDIIVEYRAICRFFLMNFDKIEFVDVNRHSIQNYLQLIVDERHIDMEEHFKQFTLLDYMVQMVKDAFKLQRHIVFDGVTEEEYNKWKLEQDALEKSKTGAPKITFADEPFEFDEQLIDFEEAFEEDFNKENSNGNANNGDNNSNDKSIDTNGNKLGTSISVLPTVIEENETDSYIPSTSKFNQHQHQQEQKSTDETSWDSYRPSTRKTPVSSSNGLFVSDSEYSPQTQRSTSSLPSQSNSQQQQQQQQQQSSSPLLSQNQNNQYNQQNRQSTSTGRQLPPTGPKKYQTSPPQSNSSNYSPSSLSQPSHYRPTEPRFERRIRDYQTDEQPSEEEKLLIERRKRQKFEEKKALLGKVFNDKTDDNNNQDNNNLDNDSDIVTITPDDLFYQLKKKRKVEVDNIKDIDYKTFIERLKSYDRKKDKTKPKKDGSTKSVHPRYVDRRIMEVPNKFKKVLALID